jgi:hypothetical protein
LTLGDPPSRGPAIEGKGLLAIDEVYCILFPTFMNLDQILVALMRECQGRSRRLKQPGPAAINHRVFGKVEPGTNFNQPDACDRLAISYVVRDLSVGNFSRSFTMRFQLRRRPSDHLVCLDLIAASSGQDTTMEVEADLQRCRASCSRCIRLRFPVAGSNAATSSVPCYQHVRDNVCAKRTRCEQDA